MDTSEMQELLRGYLNEMNWAGGATKDDIMAHLAGRDEALRTMVNQYVAEGTYQGPEDVLTHIPSQAWQDVQGDAWRGAESQYVEDVPSGFREGPVGRDTSDVGTGADLTPRTPGFGQSAGPSGRGTGAAFGEAGASGTGIGEVDLGISGDDETIRQSGE